MGERLAIGFLPLVDAALPILAFEHGFARNEGIDLQLVRDNSWATLLDRLLYGETQAAHMVAPLAIATSLGRGRPALPLSVPFVLGLNGNTIALRCDLADQVCKPGRLGDPRIVGMALAAAAKTSAVRGKRLRFGVIHRHSSHNYMLRYWLAATGVRPDDDIEIVTLAPSASVEALGRGDVDGICIGEPWNTLAIERGAGRAVLATAQIWRRGVEKVLAMREDVLEQRREAVEALIRALVKAARHFVDPQNWKTNSAILSSPEYLNGSENIIRRTLADRLVLSGGGSEYFYPDFMFQYREAANFPWVSQAEWLYTQMIRWEGPAFDAAEAKRAARVFRPDIYRSALRGSEEPLPGASSKVEGSLSETTVVGTEQGFMTMEPNRFFDGRSFDPADAAGYLANLP
jgi:NitT/TauT family transport system ATP-binding protein